MEGRTLEFCSKAAYVALAAFLLVMTVLFLTIWARNYWRERDAKSADEMSFKKAQRHFQKERESWIGIIDDLHDESMKLADDISRLKGENEMLKKLLKESEELRKEH